MLRWLASLALAAAACGGSSAHQGDGDTTANTTQRPSGGGQRPAATGPLTEPECIGLADHMLDVALTEKRATLPPDKVPTDEQVATIRTQMRSEVGTRCVGGPRDGYDCAMAATTRSDIEDCAPGEGAP